MAREWTVACKRCGKAIVGYSDRSYRASLEFGFSRPEYCEECQIKHAREKRSLGAPYFGITIESLFSNPTGEVDHGERIHQATETKSGFDLSRYGLQESDVARIAEWFQDPDQRVIILRGETGSGKSTGLPYLLANPHLLEQFDFPEDHFTRDGQILVTQPRIVAAKGITTHLARDIHGSNVGKGYDIGYAYSGEDKTDWRNVLVQRTDGQHVNHWVRGDLSQYGLVIIDEAHERNKNIEQLCRFFVERMALFPHLKLIIASATIDPEDYAEMFCDHNPTVVEIAGQKRINPKTNEPFGYVTHFRSEDEALPYHRPEELSQLVVREAVNQVKDIVEGIMRGHEPWGDVLVFFHGTRMIDKAVEDIKAWANRDEKTREKVAVYPLYRNLPEKQKDLVTEVEGNAKVVRVICSTNIAEASVTIDGVVHEVETGLEYQTSFRAETDSTDINITLISQASAKQRWGRTGRTRDGIVHCLYTKEQFRTLFLEQSTPEIQRSSLEEITLTSKAAGFPDITTGWLDELPSEEIERSRDVLVNTGAITPEGWLTRYGLMLQRFGYPARLVEALLLADDIGCAVEFSTALAVLRNGGQRRILRWSTRWDAYTKLEAHNRHQALMAGCQDDIDFVLKLYKAWSELPWLYRPDVSRLDDEEFDSLRKQWCRIHFLRHKVLSDEIAAERDQILDRLNIGKKGEESRPIDLTQIGNVRWLIQTFFPEGLTDPGDDYTFNTHVDCVQGSLITASVKDLRLSQASDRVDFHSQDRESWWRNLNTGSTRSIQDVPNKAELELKLFSRFFACCVSPVGYRYQARVRKSFETFAWIRVDPSQIQLQQQAEQFIDSDVDDEETIYEDMEDDDETSSTEEDKEVRLSEIGIYRPSVDIDYAIEFASGTKIKPGDTYTIEVVSYRFESKRKPIVLAKVLPQPSSFERMSQHYRYSDEVEVEVIDLLTFPRDYRATLVVREPATDMIVLVEPEDVGFTRSSLVLNQIPLGTQMTMTIEHFDAQRERVRLSTWDRTESLTSGIFTESKSGDHTALASVTVHDVWSNGNVIFVLDASSPEEGFALLVRGFGYKLPKPYWEFEIGETYLLQIIRKTDRSYYAHLPQLPKKAEHYISSDERSGQLSWVNRELRFTGHMTYEKLYEFKTYAEDDPNYLKAVEMLYWRSNQIALANFVDNEWYQAVKAEFPIGSHIDNCQVIEVNSGGIVVEVTPDLSGFVHHRNITSYFKARRHVKHSDFLPVGVIVDVRVLELQPVKKELLLDLVSAPNPFAEFAPGQICDGIIAQVNSKGVYVDIAPGIRGRVLHKDVYSGVRRTEDLYHAGDQVRVKVLTVDLEENLIDLSMKIPELHPASKYHSGQEITGPIKNITHFGLFVELEPDLDGLVHISEISHDYIKDINALFQVGQVVTARIMSIDINEASIKDTNIKLTMKN